MGKLSAMKPALAALGSAVPYLSDDAATYSRLRDDRAPWRQWYKTARWQRMRMQVLVAAAFTCTRCGRTGESPEMVADHITPHRGSAALFWREANLQCLCKHCHDTAKQREERGGLKTHQPPHP